MRPVRQRLLPLLLGSPGRLQQRQWRARAAAMPGNAALPAGLSGQAAPGLPGSGRQAGQAQRRGPADGACWRGGRSSGGMGSGTTPPGTVNTISIYHARLKILASHSVLCRQQ